MSEQNYERTSCPELWKQSCWGRQPYQGNPEVYIHREVLGSLMCKPNGAWRGENIRLRATSKTAGLEKYHCFTNRKDGSMPHSNFYDHSEFYNILRFDGTHSHLGRMMWFSPYMSQDSGDALIIKSKNWVEVKPLYSTSCRTFMKVVLSSKKWSDINFNTDENDYIGTVEAAKRLGYDITPLILASATSHE
tara:strand:- start:40 stop:612 length:573 start_codon:yes stop_codon:yes gene_type:complete